MRLKNPLELATTSARTFLFVSPCDWEKQQWVEVVIAGKGAEVVRLSALEEMREEVRTLDLFGRTRVLVIDDVDCVKGFEMVGNSTTIVILLASNFKPVAHLDREGIAVLDVSQEKPWDRDRRVLGWVKDEVRKTGKEIESAAVELLVALIGPDFALLYQEIKKLAVYVNHTIEPRDVEALCAARDLATGWQLAEAAVWKGPVALHEKGKDIGFMMPFLGQLRYQLQLGAQVAELLQHGQNVESRLPAARPHMLKKIAPLAQARGLQFFLRGLKELYALEFASKSSSLDMGVLFDIFQAKLHEKAHSAS